MRITKKQQKGVDANINHIIIIIIIIIITGFSIRILVGGKLDEKTENVQRAPKVRFPREEDTSL